MFELSRRTGHSVLCSVISLKVCCLEHVTEDGECWLPSSPETSQYHFGLSKRSRYLNTKVIFILLTQQFRSETQFILWRSFYKSDTNDKMNVNPNIVYIVTSRLMNSELHLFSFHWKIKLKTCTVHLCLQQYGSFVFFMSSFNTDDAMLSGFLDEPLSCPLLWWILIISAVWWKSYCYFWMTRIQS